MQEEYRTTCRVSVPDLDPNFLGSWIWIRIRFRVKSWIRILIHMKVKIQELSRLKIEVYRLKMAAWRVV
jgi:hypothetical protein